MSLESISGVIPGICATADIKGVRSETGIGALMPWAGKLWFITYVAHTARSGGGTGLFSLDQKFAVAKHPASVVGTYANRLVHSQSSQVIIGPHIIDVDGNVRTVSDLVEHRLTATMVHLYSPDNMVYFLTMEGLFFETDVYALQCRLLFDLKKELNCSQGAKPHFKAGWTNTSGEKPRVVVANNTYDEREYLGRKSDGRLAEWDGEKWSVLEQSPFNEVVGNRVTPLFATGWDKASAILKVLANGEWSTYRLPKATQAMDHMILTEWPRIREVETERFLMDCHGLFYELSHLSYEGKIWGIRPVCSHLRMIPDFCSWQGLLVLAGNQVTPIWDSNLLGGEPQSNLWFGKTDDLWNLGKPKGGGGPWWDCSVSQGEASDPYLMTGFDKKCLHLAHSADRTVKFIVEVDFLGNQSWQVYTEIEVPACGYKYHVFPEGFSAHWVRITASESCNASGYFIYT